MMPEPVLPHCLGLPTGFRWRLAALLVAGVVALSGCGGNEEAAFDPEGDEPASAAAMSSSARVDADASAAAPSSSAGSPAATESVEQRQTKPAMGTARPLVASQRDAVRLAQQASFGPTELLVAQIRKQGAERWVAAQMRLDFSRYSAGGSGAAHQHTNRNQDFCTGRGNDCWRDWYSSTPLVWDFYRNAVGQPDQLRQRVALALQQILVVSNLEVSGTYGFRYYYNTLLQEAFGNYREILRKTILSPVMGDYLNHANNDRNAPNENFARELLQLFAIGTCRLNQDGSLHGGGCTPTYDNETVRAYAFALTGLTYPPGGASPWGCSTGFNCRYYQGDMVPAAASRH
jgi:uncharacterized protein (DUF1800 family)